MQPALADKGKIFLHLSFPLNMQTLHFMEQEQGHMLNLYSSSMSNSNISI